MNRTLKNTEYRNFPDEEIEKIRKDHLNKIKEFKDSLDEWAKFYNKNYDELADDYNSAKQTKSENAINNFSLKMKTFLKEEVSVIDNYITTVMKSISNKLKGKKKSKGPKIDYIISQNIDNRIDAVCENNKNSSEIKIKENDSNPRSSHNLEPSRNNIQPQSEIQQSQPSNIEPRSILVQNDLKGKISIKKENFQKFLQKFDSKFAHLKNDPRRLFICIKTYNYGKKIYDNVKNLFDKYLSSVNQDGQELPTLIGGSTKNINKILSEMDRILFNQQVTVSLIFFESLDDIYEYFDNCGLRYDNIECKI
jgi:hypothetical protein